MNGITGGFYNIDKDGGSMNDTLRFDAVTANLGRNDRDSETVIVETTDNTVRESITVHQSGRPDFVERAYTTLDSVDPDNIPWDTTTANFNFQSNSKYLNFALSQPKSNISISEVWVVIGGQQWTSYTPDANGNIEPSGDPGVDDAYRFLVVLSLSQNTTSEDYTASLVITGNSGVSGQQGQLTLNLTHKAQPQGESDNS